MDFFASFETATVVGSEIEGWLAFGVSYLSNFEKKKKVWTKKLFPLTIFVSTFEKNIEFLKTSLNPDYGYFFAFLK